MMRRGVIIVLKLSGLFMAYRGVSFLLSVWFMFAASVSDRELVSEMNLGMQLAGVIGYALFSFVVAWLLIARAGRLADWLGASAADDQGVVSPASEALVSAGVKLLGIYLCATALPELLQQFSQASLLGQFSAGGYAMTRTIGALLKLVIALLLMLRGRQIVALIGKAESTGGLKVALITGAAVVLLGLLVHGIATHPWWRQARYSRHSVASPSSVPPPVPVSEPGENPEWYAVPDGDAMMSNEAALTAELSLP